jgi:tetratricopeptide (TPR) repeat protein
VTLIESFIAARKKDVWNDCVMVFGRDGSRSRRTGIAAERAAAYNIRSVFLGEEIGSFEEKTEDQIIIARLKDALSAKAIDNKIQGAGGGDISEVQRISFPDKGERLLQTKPEKSNKTTDTEAIAADCARRAEALVSQREFEKAETLLREAIRVCPGKMNYYEQLSDLMASCARMREAVELIEKAIELGPTNRRVRLKLANHRFRRGNLAGAKTAYLACIDGAPDAPWPRFGLAQVLLRQGKDAEALEVLRGVLARDPNNAEAITKLAEAHAANGSYAEAVREVRRAIDIDPAARRFYLLGNILAKQRKFAEGLIAFRQAALRAPKNMEFADRLKVEQANALADKF